MCKFIYRIPSLAEQLLYIVKKIKTGKGSGGLKYCSQSPASARRTITANFVFFLGISFSLEITISLSHSAAAKWFGHF